MEKYQKTMMKKDNHQLNYLKNIVLIFTYIISYVPRLFYGATERLHLGLLSEKTTRIDFFFFYYSIYIQFLILAYCVCFNKGLSRMLTLFILILCALDLFQLFIFGTRASYGMVKLGISLVLFYILHKKLK